jgi:glycosyltransferase involved in cell wall biosynthesis
MPLFSIIVPVYKVEDFLNECVNSVLAQEFVDFEIFLVNDGSPDNCPQICDDFAERDKRVKVIHKSNGGLSDARNFGIKASKGDYLLFLDSDDYWKDIDFLKNISDSIQSQTDVEVVNFGWIKYYQLSNQFVPDKRNFNIIKTIGENNNDYTKRLLKHDLFVASAWNKCIKRSFVLENEIFFKVGLRSEDMDWCGRILYSKPVMTCANIKPYVYRQDRIGSITSSVGIGHLRDIIGMIKVAQENSKIIIGQEKMNYLSFYAVQYLTLLFNHNVSTEISNSALSQDIYQLRKVLPYDLNFKVKVANRIMIVLGYNFMKKLLSYYVLAGRK